MAGRPRRSIHMSVLRWRPVTGEKSLAGGTVPRCASQARIVARSGLPPYQLGSHLESGGGGFVYHCAGAISTMTGRCAAMCVASSNCGSIRPASIPIGIAPGIGGSTCWETKIEVAGTFVRSGKYRKRRGEWNLVTWETALPSRLEIKLPSDFQQQLEKAQRTSCRDRTQHRVLAIDHFPNYRKIGMQVAHGGFQILMPHRILHGCRVFRVLHRDRPGRPFPLIS